MMLVTGCFPAEIIIQHSMLANYISSVGSGIMGCKLGTNNKVVSKQSYTYKMSH